MKNDLQKWCDGHLIPNNILCLCKYLSKSFETLQTETTRYYGKDLWEKIGGRIDHLGPRPLQWISRDDILNNCLSESIGILGPKGKIWFLIAVLNFWSLS